MFLHPCVPSSSITFVANSTFPLQSFTPDAPFRVVTLTEAVPPPWLCRCRAAMIRYKTQRTSHHYTTHAVLHDGVGREGRGT